MECARLVAALYSLTCQAYCNHTILVEGFIFSSFDVMQNRIESLNFFNTLDKSSYTERRQVARTPHALPCFYVNLMTLGNSKSLAASEVRLLELTIVIN